MESLLWYRFIFEGLTKFCQHDIPARLAESIINSRWRLLTFQAAPHGRDFGQFHILQRSPQYRFIMRLHD